MDADLTRLQAGIALRGLHRLVHEPEHATARLLRQVAQDLAALADPDGQRQDSLRPILDWARSRSGDAVFNSSVDRLTRAVMLTLEPTGQDPDIEETDHEPRDQHQQRHRPARGLLRQSACVA